jgi:rhodanese-related sulfurtransferase
MPQRVPSVELSRLPADAVLLDVREDDEWKAGHAPHAVHVPMGVVPARLDDMPTDGPLYVVCRSGGRSARVTAFLNANGWDAVNVDGGMLAWQAAGRPLVADSGQPQVL